MCRKPVGEGAKRVITVSLIDALEGLEVGRDNGRPWCSIRAECG